MEIAIIVTLSRSRVPSRSSEANPTGGRRPDSCNAEPFLFRGLIWLAVAV